MTDTLPHAPNLHLLDEMPILYGGHAGSTTECCARELLAMVITGKPDIEDHPCITAHQAVGVPLNDGPWRDDEHRTAVMLCGLFAIQLSPIPMSDTEAICRRAELAYKAADAMLAARQQNGEAGHG